MGTPVIKQPVTHVIYDFDGLLVDTEPLYTLANSRCLEAHGKEFTMDIKSGQMGRKEHEAITYLLDRTGLTDIVTVKQYAQQLNSHLNELFLRCPAKPGAERLAHSHRDWVDLVKLHVLTGDDPSVKRGKPHPDGFIETMKRFVVPPESPSNVLVFEDAPNGVRAALDAGMQVIQVPDPHPAFQVDDLTKKDITVLDSLEKFLPAEFGLPAFD